MFPPSLKEIRWSNGPVLCLFVFKNVTMFLKTEYTFLKTEWVCIGRFDWLFLSVLFDTKTEAEIMFAG